MSILKDEDLRDHESNDEFIEDVDIPGLDYDGVPKDSEQYKVKSKLVQQMEIHVRTRGEDIDEEEHKKREYFNKIVDEATGASQVEQGTPVKEAEGSLLQDLVKG